MECLVVQFEETEIEEEGIVDEEDEDQVV